MRQESTLGALQSEQQVPGYTERVEPVMQFTTDSPSLHKYYMHWIADRLATVPDSGCLMQDMQRNMKQYGSARPWTR